VINGHMADPRRALKELMLHGDQNENVSVVLQSLLVRDATYLLLSLRIHTNLMAVREAL
jgi:hypothetical protein